jgi:hypothetical protein
LGNFTHPEELQLVIPLLNFTMERFDPIFVLNLKKEGKKKRNRREIDTYLANHGAAL